MNRHQVEYVIVGGMACVVHGSSVVTEDMDVCAPLDPENAARLLKSLEGLNPRWRTTPARPPLTTDPTELRGFRNLYLTTDLGYLDVLTEITGVGDYETVAKQSIETEFGGVKCRVLDLPALIRAKRALGRPTDIKTAVELEAIQQRIQDRGKQT